MVELVDGQDEESINYDMARRPNFYDSYFLDVLILRIQICCEIYYFSATLLCRKGYTVGVFF